MSDILTMAKWYLAIGWSLIPILPESKKPAVAWTDYQTRKATLPEVTEWIDKGWHLAVVTGDISGILVVDDDRRKHGLNEWGFDTPVVSKTQNNGKHYFFKYDRELHSHSNPVIRIDLKAWHSYCVLPPFNGREWVKKPSKQNIEDLISVPDETVRLINSDTKQANGERKPIVMSDFMNVTEGGRTDSLHKIACSLFAKNTEEEAVQILIGINQTYTPPLNQSEFEYQVSRAREFVKLSDRSEKELVNKALPVLQGLAEDRLVLKTTGFPMLDEIIGEIRSGGSYLFAGEEKSGKTSLLLNLLSHWVEQKHQVFYGSTEMQKDDTSEYLTGINDNKNWLKDNPNFIFYDLGESGSFSEHLKIIEEQMRQGVRILAIDNLTSYRDFTDIQGKAEWEKISNAGDAYRRLARKYNAIVFLVLHVNQGGKLREFPHSVKDMILADEPEKIFSESVTVYRRPDTSDIKGGSGFRSQTQGTLLLWRPYQQFGKNDLNRLALLIVENNRFGKTGDVPLIFDGSTKSFRQENYTGDLVEVETEREWRNYADN